MLDPILFLVDVNDIDVGLTFKISKFADGTKIMGRVATSAAKLYIQSNLDILVSWSKKLQVKFNVDMCKILHIRNNNQYTKYTRNGSKLSKVSHEKDFGVIIGNDLKPSRHCSDVVKETNKLVRFIGRISENKYDSYPCTIQCTCAPSSRILC